MSLDTPFLPGLSSIDGLDLHARFDGGTLSSDGGVLMLREIERRMGIADMLASCLCDRRDGARASQTPADLRTLPARRMLDEFFTQESGENRYRLTLLKKLSQSTRRGRIKKSVDPQAWLTDTLARIDELLPWRYVQD